MACSERLPTRSNSLAERACFSQVQGRPQLGAGQSLLIIGGGGLGLHAVGWAKILTEAKARIVLSCRYAHYAELFLIVMLVVLSCR
jgi:NADPH:quinone reductase-like Zn-dependent oxidoreductase